METYHEGRWAVFKHYRSELNPGGDIPLARDLSQEEAEERVATEHAHRYYDSQEVYMTQWW